MNVDLHWFHLFAAIFIIISFYKDWKLFSYRYWKYVATIIMFANINSIITINFININTIFSINIIAIVEVTIIVFLIAFLLVIVTTLGLSK